MVGQVQNSKTPLSPIRIGGESRNSRLADGAIRSDCSSAIIWCMKCTYSDLWAPVLSISMDIRRKASLVVLILTLGIMLALIALSEGIALGGFLRAEREMVQNRMQDFTALIQREKEGLRAAVLSLAERMDATVDDTDPSEAPSIPTIAKTYRHAESVLLFTPSGLYQNGAQITPEGRQKAPPESELKGATLAAERVMNAAFQPATSLTVHDGRLILAAGATIRNPGAPTPRGILVQTRVYTLADLDSFLRRADITMTLHLPDRGLQTGVTEAMDHLSPTAPAWAIAIDDQTIAGYLLLRDDDRSAGVLRIVSARTMYAQGRLSLRYFVLALMAICALFGVLAAWMVDRLMRAGIAQREGEERYRAVTETAGDAIVAIRDERIVSWNRGARNIFGYESGEVLGRPVDMLVCRSESGGTESFRDIIHVPMNDPMLGSPREIRAMRRNGQPFYAEISVGAWIVHDVEFRSIVLRDITERRNAESEKRRLEDQIRSAQKSESLGMLAGGIAHDFNNLLVGILGNAEMALDAPLPSGVRPLLESVCEAGAQAADLVRQMLAYSGHTTMEVRRMDVNRVIRDSAHLLQAAIGHRLELSFDLRDQLPEVDADPAQIQQAITNLVLNSAEAIRERPGAISIRTYGMTATGSDSFADAVTTEGTRAGPHVAIEVSDDGGGIPFDILPKIFDPFFSTKFTGRGLGLPVALGILRAHHGTIRIRTEARGTTLTLFFPASASPSRAVRQELSPDAWRGTGTVLLIDDEEIVRDVARRMTERLGFQTLSACDGIEGMARFREHMSDIRAVILDMTMPRMDGEETLRQIRAVHATVPVILVSGFTESDISPAMRNDPHALFMQKPFRFPSMAGFLRQAVEGGSAAARSVTPSPGSPG